MSNPTALVQTLWNCYNILRDDGLSFRLRRGFGGQDGDYVEQLIPRLRDCFLKMADEQSRPFNKRSPIPKGKDWPALLSRSIGQPLSRQQ